MTANNKFRQEKRSAEKKKITAHLNKLNHNSVLEGGKDATTVNKRAELVLNVSGAFLHIKGGHMLIHDWCC